ncbi:hypothetical protein TanjilG_28152 [Lupinus angustifolius]|uniref:Germin-like protein n=1 Tax=Lupinus angustifolius TaxID=3871 RepID=A0A4P1REH7_LUPAN|nr:PREDICTED: auxin-binding protein ABP20-like [Lupinus angustifolius]OIW09553.1 hypothetical protein TanjilG_28152 [Lupinus angustifolius]
MTLLFFLFGFLLSTTISNVAAKDFCIADLKGGLTPGGYPCKSLQSVTVDDFVFSNFTVGTPNQLKMSFTPAFVEQLSALNGLGFSLARVELEEGGVVPIHTHVDATEVTIPTGGNFTIGFISSDNVVYMKTISEGNIFVIPKGLLHFGLNVGKGKHSAIYVFSSEHRSLQVVDLALFGSNLDSNIVAKTTFLDIEQIKKLKTLFKGSG